MPHGMARSQDLTCIWWGRNYLAQVVMRGLAAHRVVSGLRGIRKSGLTNDCIPHQRGLTESEGVQRHTTDVELTGLVICTHGRISRSVRNRSFCLWASHQLTPYSCSAKTILMNFHQSPGSIPSVLHR